MTLLAGLLAVAALQAQSPVAQAADDFAHACLATGGDRAAAAAMAESRQWTPTELGGISERAVWADGYRAAQAVVAVFQSPASTVGVISGPALNHCLVMLPAAAGEWREAAATLDASDRLVVFPNELQPGEGGGRDGVVRYYALSERKPDGSSAGMVTVSEDAARGLVLIKMMRPAPAATDQR